MNDRPRRTIALGPPYDDGRVPEPTTAVDEQVADIQAHLRQLDGTLRILVNLRRASGAMTRTQADKLLARLDAEAER